MHMNAQYRLQLLSKLCIHGIASMTAVQEPTVCICRSSNDTILHGRTSQGLRTAITLAPVHMEPIFSMSTSPLLSFCTLPCFSPPFTIHDTTPLLFVTVQIQIVTDHKHKNRTCCCTANKVCTLLTCVKRCMGHECQNVCLPHAHSTSHAFVSIK